MARTGRLPVTSEKKLAKRALREKLLEERNKRNAELLKDGITNEIWIIKGGSYLEKVEKTRPTTTPIPTPIEAPIPTPIEAPIPTPIEAPIPTPIEAPVPTPKEDPMSSPDDYVSPLMGARRPDPAAAARPFTLPSQAKKKPKPQVQTNYSVFKVDPSWPPELVEKMSNNHCQLCNVKMTSQPMAKSHYDGSKHQKKINAFLFNQNSNAGAPKTEATEGTETDDTSTETVKMVRPDTSAAWKPMGPELNPNNFSLDCTGLPDMHIHSDGALEGSPNKLASKEEIAKISCCLIKFILKECLKAKRNKEKEKAKPKKRKVDGEEVDDDKNAVGKIEGRHCRIAYYSLVLNKEIWLGRKKIAKSVETRPDLKENPLQREMNITAHQVSMAENDRINIGGGMTLYFDIHIWQNINEPHRILVTGDASGSAGVQTAMMKPMYTFFTSMAQQLLRRAMTWVKNPQLNSPKKK